MKKNPGVFAPKILACGALAALLGGCAGAGSQEAPQSGLRTGSSPAATQAAAQAAAQAAPQASQASEESGAALRAGEIRLDGRVLSVDLGRGRASLEVAAFSLPNGRTGQLPRPRRKAVAVGAGTVLLRASQRHELAEGLRPGAIVGVVGLDTGTGRVLAARLVEVVADAPPPRARILSSRLDEPPVRGRTTSSEMAPEMARPRSRRARAARRNDISRLISSIRAARSTGELDGLDFEIERLKQSYLDQWERDAGSDGSRAPQGVNNFYLKMIAACENLKGATMTKRNILGGFKDRAQAEEAYYEGALENQRDAHSQVP